MSVPRVLVVCLLLLPIACSGGPANPRPVADDRQGPGEVPDDGDANATEAEKLIERARALVDKKEYDKAIADFEEAIHLAPDDSEGYNALAWLLATCPQDGVRDGKKAVELATKACELTKYEDADPLSTLAAAEAECGHFETAVKWQKKALEVGFDDDDDTKEAREQLKLYQAGKPYRDE